MRGVGTKRDDERVYDGGVVLPVPGGDRAAPEAEMVVPDVAPAPVSLGRLQVALHTTLDLNALGKEV